MQRHIVFAGLLAAVLSLPHAARAQEREWHEISVQTSGVFTTDNGDTQRTTESGGFLVNYRLHFNPWLAAEANYGYNRNSHHHITLAGPFGVQANAHQTTGALVLTIPTRFSRVEPYVLGGGGSITFDPRGSDVGTVGAARQQTEAAFVYGGGANINLHPRLALRMEYRGLVYNRPDFGLPLLESSGTAHTAQPSAGFSFRF
jgi:opacity protein-like surface antigen